MHRLLLWAQRRAHAVPVPLRRLGRLVLGRVGGGETESSGPLEDWSTPLLPGRGTGDLESLPPVPDAGAGPDLAPPTVGRPASAGEAPLRVVVAIDVLDVGGMDEFVAFLGRRLPRHGVQTVVAYASTTMPGYQGQSGRLVRALERDGVATVALTAESCREWLRAHRPDVISAHGAPDWLLDVAAELGVPWVETLHGMHHFLHPDTWEPERRRSHRIQAQIAVSELVRRQYLARNPNFPAERIVTVPNGVDEERLRWVDRSQARAALGLRDEFVFLSLARYGLQKNTFALVTAFAQVAAVHPAAHLLVAGRADDQRYYEQVRAHAERLTCASRIHLRGHCANTSALLAAADAFVLDSFFEGWPLASMEALAAGLPVVMSDVGGAREQLGDGGRGHLVDNPAGDPEAIDWQLISDLRFRSQGNQDQLVSAMSALVADRARWAADRQRLRDEARSAFSAELCLSRHATVLRSVVQGKPVPTFLHHARR
ncbi:glycosyltransferase [Micromonospora sp. NPDC047548]|uniref:glycosyltransferase n=1 Tax=Micromonospora sp. NPDC047548 TaxID=3155624 RepID=UPI0033CAAE8B